MKGPLMRLALRLQRDLTEQRRRNTILSCAYTRVLMQRDVLSQQLEQTRRDCEILALSARDRDAALAFLRTAHDIDQQEEVL